MDHDTRLDEWLDLWEEQQASGRQVSLDEFVQRHCQNAPAGLVTAFRSKVSALRSMDAQLRAVGVGNDSTGAKGGSETGNSSHWGPDFKPGAEPVPGYRLEKPLGRGGFGEVWKAIGPGGFAVALKMVRLDRKVGDAERHALETIKEVRHPHLIALFGSWDIPGYLVIAMELADGTLLNLLQQARESGQPGIPRSQLLRYLAETAEALDFLHMPRSVPGRDQMATLQHRDVKPHNLLLVGQSVKVADFGLVRVLQGTQTGHTGMMTCAYAAPEFFNQQTSIHSDQYSLAVAYCELRGGRLPFTGNLAQMMQGHLQGEPDLSMLPAEEQGAVRRALAKNPADRWPSCGDFVRALTRQGTAPGQDRPAAGAQKILPLPAQPDENVNCFPLHATPTRPGIQAATTQPLPATSGHRRRWLSRAVPLVATVLLAVVAMVFAFSERLRSLLPFTGGLSGSERRGFADTIVKYRNRPYDKATWRKIQDAGTLQELANAGPLASLKVLLTGVAGWDDENFFITGTRWGRRGVVFRCRNNKWSFLGESRDANMEKTRQRLLDRDTLVFAGGHDLFTVSERGIVYHDEPGGERSCFADWAEICPIATERFAVFYHKPGHACQVVNGKASPPEGNEALIRALESMPPGDRSVGNIQLTRTLASGKVVAIFNKLSDHRLVALEDGVWRELSGLPKVDVTDFWVCADGATPRFLVAVGDNGKLYLYSFKGEIREMTVPAPPGLHDQSAWIALALFKVWGVSEDKFWVMARSGTIWERTGNEWRLVVPEVTGKDHRFLDAWVSPTGKVIAVTTDQIYRLD